MFAILTQIFIGIILVVGAVVELNDSLMIFWDPVGIVLIFGGCVVVASIKLGFKGVFEHLRLFVLLAKTKPVSGSNLVQQCLEFSKASGGDFAAMKSNLSKITDAELRFAVELFCERTAIQSIFQILSNRDRSREELLGGVSQTLRQIAKYPPSFGIIGTVLGLISMLQKMGSNGSMDQLAKAMALGLVATFYGLFLSNFILAPLADYVAHRAKKLAHNSQIILHFVKLLNQKESSFVISDAMLALDKDANKFLMHFTENREARPADDAERGVA